ncbi:MAG: recombination mediator RecR [Polyangiales bacterium]
MSDGAEDIDALAELGQLLTRLPGIGPRSAARLSHYVLETEPSYAGALGQALSQLHTQVQRCSLCRNYCARSPCRICRDPRRCRSQLCVVARPAAVDAIERSGTYRGHYFVLHGLLSPLDGRGPDTLPLSALLERCRELEVEEVILATPLSVEGEATALWLTEALSDCGGRLTRIASGLPHGSDLEFADQWTMSRALEGRRRLD